jgi:hypothetical protein
MEPHCSKHRNTLNEIGDILLCRFVKSFLRSPPVVYVTNTPNLRVCYRPTLTQPAIRGQKPQEIYSLQGQVPYPMYEVLLEASQCLHTVT